MRSPATGWFVLALLLLLSAPAMAWGPGAHAVIAAGAAAERGITFPSHYLLLQTVYGAVGPDLAWGAGEPLSGALGEATHHAPGCFEPWQRSRPWSKAERFFAGGWVTHNEEWGADYYAHIESPLAGASLEPGPGYVVERAALLAASEGVSAEIAHYYTEVAIDLLVDHQFPELDLGAVLTQGASGRSDSIPTLLAKSYRDVPGASGLTVRLLELEFRASMVAYGEALALPAGEDEAAFAAGMALLYGLTPQKSADCLVAAEAICQAADAHYLDALSATIDLVAAAPWP